MTGVRRPQVPVDPRLIYARPTPLVRAVVAPEPEPETPSVLTDRQTQILRLVSDGYRRAEIGARLYITEDTVKTTLRSVFDRLGARNAPHAVNIAHQRGLLP